MIHQLAWFIGGMYLGYSVGWMIRAYKKIKVLEKRVKELEEKW